MPIIAGIRKLTPHIKEDRTIIIPSFGYQGAKINNKSCPLTTNSEILIVGKMERNRNKTAMEDPNTQNGMSIPNIFAAQAY